VLRKVARKRGLSLKRRKMSREDSITVVHVDLEKGESAKKSYPDLRAYVGGVGTASKLVLDYQNLDPIVFSIGPLNGFFPYASKTCVAFLDEGKFVDTYGGGRLSTRLKYTGVDAFILEKKAREPCVLVLDGSGAVLVPADTAVESLGIPGRRCGVEVLDGSVLIDGYFAFGDQRLSKKLGEAGIKGIVVSATSGFQIENRERYDRQYNEMLGKVGEMLIEAGSNPSCSGCPMGCARSNLGENGGNVFIHSLVSCVFSESIYSSIPLAFACLNSLGYDYVHEDLEALPDLVYTNINKIYEKASDSKLETE